MSYVHTFYICGQAVPSCRCDSSTLAPLSLLTTQGFPSARCTRPCGAFELRLFGSRHTRIQEGSYGDQ